MKIPDPLPPVFEGRCRCARVRPEQRLAGRVSMYATAMYGAGSPYTPRARIAIAADGVRVTCSSAPALSLARADVELVGRVKSGTTMPYRSIVFLLVGGGTWDVWLVPARLLRVFEAYGWPVDDGALLDWGNAIETAVPTTVPLPPPPS